MTQIVFAAIVASATVGLSMPTVTLFNNTVVDLEIVRGDRVVATILPGKSHDFTPEAREWINFGAVAHQYEFANVDWPAIATNRGGTPVRMQAQADGAIYLAGEQPFPAKPDTPQPPGLPLRPVGDVDLTRLELGKARPPLGVFVPWC